MAGIAGATSLRSPPLSRARASVSFDHLPQADREDPDGHEDHRLLRRHRQRPRRARARAPARRARARRSSSPTSATRTRPRAAASGSPSGRPQALLEAGAAALGQPDIPRHVVLSASTPEGLRELAVAENADVIVFGSEYRTAPGHVDPQASARRLLDGGPVALAFAPAGFAERSDYEVRDDRADRRGRRPVRARDGGGPRRGSGRHRRRSRPSGNVDLLVVGSKPGTVTGRVTISAAAEYLIELSRCPVIVLPRGRRRALRLRLSRGGRRAGRGQALPAANRRARPVVPRAARVCPADRRSRRRPPQATARLRPSTPAVSARTARTSRARRPTRTAAGTRGRSAVERPRTIPSWPRSARASACNRASPDSGSRLRGRINFAMIRTREGGTPCRRGMRGTRSHERSGR